MPIYTMEKLIEYIVSDNYIKFDDYVRDLFFKSNSNYRLNEIEPCQITIDKIRLHSVVGDDITQERNQISYCTFTMWGTNTIPMKIEVKIMININQFNVDYILEFE